MRDTSPVIWLRTALKVFETFPAVAQRDMQRALTVAAEGEKSDIAKPFKGVGSGVFEIALKSRGDAYRLIYAVQLADAVYVIDASEEIHDRLQNTEGGRGSDPGAAETTGGEFAMRTEEVELVRGSGNIFRDFGHPNADLEQAKAILAAKIIRVMDEKNWTARAAETETGVGHTDLSRIRNVKLDRFTLDRLITILGRFDQEVQFTFDVRPRPASEPASSAA